MIYTISKNVQIYENYVNNQSFSVDFFFNKRLWAVSSEQRAVSSEQRAVSGEQRAESGEQWTESGEQVGRIPYLFDNQFIGLPIPVIYYLNKKAIQ